MKGAMRKIGQGEIKYEQIDWEIQIAFYQCFRRYSSLVQLQYTIKEQMEAIMIDFYL